MPSLGVYYLYQMHPERDLEGVFHSDSEIAQSQLRVYKTLRELILDGKISTVFWEGFGAGSILRASNPSDLIYRIEYIGGKFIGTYGTDEDILDEMIKDPKKMAFYFLAREFCGRDDLFIRGWEFREMGRFNEYLERTNEIKRLKEEILREGNPEKIEDLEQRIRELREVNRAISRQRSSNSFNSSYLQFINSDRSAIRGYAVVIGLSHERDIRDITEEDLQYFGVELHHINCV